MGLCWFVVIAMNHSPADPQEAVAEAAEEALEERSMMAMAEEALGNDLDGL